MPTAADLDLHLHAIAAGDERAFGHWAAGAEPILRRCLRAFAASVDAEAVVQEVLLRAWQSAPRIEVDDKPNGLLRLSLRAARNLAVSELRRRRVAEQALQQLAQRSEADVAAWSPPDPLLRERIADCRRKLPQKPACALEQRLANSGGHPDRVLAANAGMQLNTFLQNITRARKLLAECLRRAGVDLGQELA
jgi:RNA polymerase sigma-70 factor (ECF subfamily)